MKRILLLIICSFAFSTIINVPEDYSTIQGAINNSIALDTIFVSDGFYSENLYLNGKSLILIGESEDGVIMHSGSSDDDILDI